MVGNPINQCSTSDNSSCMKEARNLKFKFYYNLTSTPYGYLWDPQYYMMSLTHRPTDYYGNIASSDVVNSVGSSANTSYQIDLIYSANIVDAANLSPFAWQVAYEVMYSTYIYDYNMVQSVYNYVYNTLSSKLCRDKLELFAEELHYYDGNPTLSATPQYDGKIAWAEWQTGGIKNRLMATNTML